MMIIVDCPLILTVTQFIPTLTFSSAESAIAIIQHTTSQCLWFKNEMLNIVRVAES